MLTHAAIWFEAIGMDDLATAGGKNALLGVLTREFAEKGIRVPADLLRFPDGATPGGRQHRP